MLTRDPFFSEFDRLTQEVLGSTVPGFTAPMDVLRGPESVVLRVDLPGAARDSIELTVEALANYDCVLIATHHAAYDWQMIADHGRLIVDTRNALGRVTGSREHIVRA